MAKRSSWTAEERALLHGLDSPWKVQEFLDSLSYTTDKQTRSPRRVMRERCAHCTEGAFFAAAALYFHGHPPLVLDLRAVNDDDHVIAIYKERGHIGAVAKSNFSTLRFREPIYRTYRELALSYFEVYYNTLGEKSLRAYSRPLDLRAFNHREWMTMDEDLQWLSARLDMLRHYPLIDEEMARRLQPVDRRLYEAGLLGANPAGLYQARPDTNPEGGSA